MSSEVNTKPLPNDQDAERAIIGSIFLNNELMEQAMKLRPLEFYKPRHRAIFKKCLELREQGSAIDALTVKDSFSDEKVDKLGGMGGLAQIPRVSPKARISSIISTLFRKNTNCAF